MCGIFAMIEAERNTIPTSHHVHSAIRKLQYRGYDSWGVCFSSYPQQGLKSTARYQDQLLDTQYESFPRAIAHTRWATTGEVSSKNAHPIFVDGHAIVHNGIITNYKQLKNDFGFQCDTDTDSEVILRLFIKDKQHLPLLEGNFAFVIMTPEGKIYGYRKGTPLYIARSSYGVHFVSDIDACPAGNVEYELILQEQLVDLEVSGELMMSFSTYVEEKIDVKAGECITISEIMESQSLIPQWAAATVPELNPRTKYLFVGSGSSYYAGMAGARMLGNGSVACIPDDITFHSGFDEIVALSQSGESHDVIAAVRLYQTKKITAITNHTHSTLGKLADVTVDIKCGIERAVGATKSFLGQISLLSRMIHGSHFFRMSVFNAREYYPVATRLKDVKNIYVLGDGLYYPIALECALKFKELALIHAEAIPTTEFKHGPLALIEKGSIVIMIGATSKTAIAAEQIRARGGEVITLGVPSHARFSNIILDTQNIFEQTVAIQILTTRTALVKGIDPDFPRNLAKSITVE